MTSAKPSPTAERVALTRAIESLRPENHRICSDVYAKHFLTGRMQRIHRSWLRRKFFCFQSERYVPGVMGSVLLRTRFMDDWLLAQVRSGVRQVVNLGAGYDTRAFRYQMELKNAVVFEVDHPATQKMKISTAGAVFGALPDNLIFVSTRFNREEPGERLRSAGYLPDRRTAFVWEGVAYYLTPDAVDRTLKFIAKNSGTGSGVVFDFFPPSVADGSHPLKEARNMHFFFKKLGESITFGVSPEQMPAFLAERGFDAVDIFYSSRLKEKYLRHNRRHLKVSDIFAIARAKV